MDIYIDHEQLETDATDFEGIIADAQTQLKDTGKIIVEVRLDGDPINEDQLAGIDELLEDVIEVQLITAEPSTLACAALGECQEVLNQIREKQINAGELMQEEQHSQAMPLIQEMLQQWLTVQQTVLKTSQLLGIVLDELEVDGVSLPKGIDQLANRLKVVKELLMNQDWVGLADSLSYEMEEDVEYWEALIAEMIKNLEAQD